ncbi:N-acetyltransferase [Sphingomonas ginkgonis]|uniref:N-acetyltransferase n=1 Tax=Sphingomonas ginkgonis TaxID=2315330 RepID=A0A429VCY1_9SPHN|nr:GNAT family N-acetyltransferase [Sphingomonas ginkgonis]RST31783.1 N-acetyltransferase [Sphingomonas ginkgonis]
MAAALIRLATAGDAAAIAEIYAPYVRATRITFEEIAPGTAEMRARMGSPHHPWLIAEESGAALGYACATPYHLRSAYRWTCEVGIYLAAAAQGRGLGTELLGTLLELLRLQGYSAAIGTIALPNPSSIRLHEKLGFRPAGHYRAIGFKQGEWVDVGRWQCDLGERAEAPAEIRPFAELG